MKTYTVCHRTNGFVQHSYISASSKEDATIKALQLFTNILNIQPLNGY
ncbi:hypothetical protein NVP1063O_119 [Vibrio phage 1.063.O._10N.261.45.C7]|nr:hypothetical protein NVP1063O_119 [Vibrio phage 1.063.O._10N.261.45.C7]